MLFNQYGIKYYVLYDVTFRSIDANLLMGRKSRRQVEKLMLIIIN